MIKKKLSKFVINVNVFVVFFGCGFLNKGIVFEIVLIFVKEVDLDVNVFSKRKMVIFCMWVFIVVVLWFVFILVNILNKFVNIRVIIEKINKYIGIVSKLVDLVIFFRLIIVILMIRSIVIGIVNGYNDGIVEMIVFVLEEIFIVIVSI